MKKYFLTGLVLAAAGTILTGCGKSPESIVNDAYNQHQRASLKTLRHTFCPTL